MARTLNELQDQVQAYIAEYGYTTGQELLDRTNNDIELQIAYADYWDAIVIPDTLDAIQRRINELEA